ncbi:type V CRISPR-associated protein Cas4 [Porphyromonas macacae]|nr:type V CRISPR-associated protein Cas4 [Porphyromonas macacae]
MDWYIPLSYLNDFVFCRFSIYFHNVYMESDSSLYYAAPQINGKNAHRSIDNYSVSSVSNRLTGISLLSEHYGLYGKLDQFDIKRGLVVERKNHLANIYKGQIYQLWGEGFCLEEMGYDVREYCFVEYSTHKVFSVPYPTDEDRAQFLRFIDEIRSFDPAVETPDVNPQKCSHCIYSHLCYHNHVANVYD